MVMDRLLLWPCGCEMPTTQWTRQGLWTNG